MDPETSGNTDSAEKMAYVLPKKSTCIIVSGMAGCGKTSFVDSIIAYLSKNGTSYGINLDPTCVDVSYPANIDIRTDVNYKEVIEEHRLGPNGAIVTALNLFSTKFDTVIELINKSSDKPEFVVIDTPGQIETLTWSTGGSIIIEKLASQFPTIIVYVIDTAKSKNPVTFMFNMINACSIISKLKLPLIIVMNKIDIVDHNCVAEWMTDDEALETALNLDESMINNLVYKFK